MPVLNIIHYGDDHCCDRECALRSLRCCADDDGREACDVATFGLMESHRAECFVSFDDYSVALAKPRLELAALSSSVGQWYPSDAHNCCY